MPGPVLTPLPHLVQLDSLWAAGQELQALRNPQANLFHILTKAVEVSGGARHPGGRLGASEHPSRARLPPLNGDERLSRGCARLEREQSPTW